jgi:hypothetical protein
MQLHGEHVIVAINNLGEWTPQLRDVLVEILNSTPGSDIEGSVRKAVAFANQIRNGVDINGNENIEPISGEGGALTAYQHAYYMADIAIFAATTGDGTSSVNDAAQSTPRIEATLPSGDADIPTPGYNIPGYP